MRFLVETLDSILNQSYTNLEIIIVDDGSTDITSQYLNTLVDQDSRVRVISMKENLGESAAINLAWISVKSRYVAIISSDDPPVLNWAELMMRAASSNEGYGFYYPNRMVIDQTGSFLRYENLHEWSLKTLYRKMIPIASAGMVIDRMRFPDDFVLRDETLKHPSDLFQVLRMAKHSSGFRVSEAVGVWREHDKNISRSGFEFANSFEKNLSVWIDENLKLISKYSSPGLSYSYVYLQYINFLLGTTPARQSLLTLFKRSNFLSKVRRYPFMIFWLSSIILRKYCWRALPQYLRYLKLLVSSNNNKGIIK